MRIKFFWDNWHISCFVGNSITSFIFPLQFNSIQFNCDKGLFISFFDTYVILSTESIVVTAMQLCNMLAIISQCYWRVIGVQWEVSRQ